MTLAPLRQSDLDPDPIVQFTRWLDQAIGAAIPLANAMSLATASPTGAPSLRTVLLKGYSDEGLVFFTTPDSIKAAQIAENPQVSLLFFWREFDRQVTINGLSSPVPVDEVARSVLGRQRGDTTTAWLAPSAGIENARLALEIQLEEALRRYCEDGIPLPATWAAFRVAPIAIEFWQGGAHALHDRFQYRRAGNAWTIARLDP